MDHGWGRTESGKPEERVRKDVYTPTHAQTHIHDSECWDRGACGFAYQILTDLGAIVQNVPKSMANYRPSP